VIHGGTPFSLGRNVEGAAAPVWTG
jgi:hypothetical protein